MISLDEMHRRLTEGDFRRRFVCVTFDDGYRDNLRMRLSGPEEIRGAVRASMSPTSFADRIGELWWLALEAVIAQNELIGLRIDGEDRWFECRSVEEKRGSTTTSTGWLRQRPTEDELRQVVRDLARAIASTWRRSAPSCA